MAARPTQKAEWLPRIASGEIVTSFALTEPDVGSDSGSVKTRAVRDGDVYRLSAPSATYQCRQGAAVHRDGAHR